MQKKTFKIPCSIENGNLVMHEDRMEEVTSKQSEVTENEIIKAAAAVGNYNSAQMRETESFLKQTGQAECFVFRQILSE